MPIVMMQESSPMTLEVYEGTREEPGERVARVELPEGMSGKGKQWKVYAAERPGNAPSEVCRCRMGRGGRGSEITLEF